MLIVVSSTGGDEVNPPGACCRAGLGLLWAAHVCETGPVLRQDCAMSATPTARWAATALAAARPAVYWTDTPRKTAGPRGPRRRHLLRPPSSSGGSPACGPQSRPSSATPAGRPPGRGPPGRHRCLWAQRRLRRGEPHSWPGPWRGLLAGEIDRLLALGQDNLAAIEATVREHAIDARWGAHRPAPRVGEPAPGRARPGLLRAAPPVRCRCAVV